MIHYHVFIRMYYCAQYWNDPETEAVLHFTSHYISTTSFSKTSSRVTLTGGFKLEKWCVDTFQIWCVDTFQIWCVDTFQVWCVDTFQVWCVDTFSTAQDIRCTIQVPRNPKQPKMTSYIHTSSCFCTTLRFRDSISCFWRSTVSCFSSRSFSCFVIASLAAFNCQHRAARWEHRRCTWVQVVWCVSHDVCVCTWHVSHDVCSHMTCVVTWHVTWCV